MVFVTLCIETGRQAKALRHRGPFREIMVFYSLQYFLFLALVFLVHHFCGERQRRPLLLLASLCFYAAFKLPYLLGALALVTAITYAAGLGMGVGASSGKRKAAFLAGICGNILVLIAIKYLPFIE